MKSISKWQRIKMWFYKKILNHNYFIACDMAMGTDESCECVYRITRSGEIKIVSINNK